MVSYLKTFTNKECIIAAQKKVFLGQILQGSGGFTTRIRRLYFKDQEVIQQGSGGYTTRIRRLYNKDKEVISRIFLVSVLLSTLVERYFVSRMQDFFPPQFDSSHSKSNVVICLKDLYLPVSTYSFVTLSKTLSNTDQLINCVVFLTNLLGAPRTCPLGPPPLAPMNFINSSF